MNSPDFLQLYSSDSDIQRLVLALQPSKGLVSIKGLAGSLDALILAASFKQLDQSFLIVAQDREEAAYLQNDLQNLIQREIFLFPMSYKRPYEYVETENANILLRAEVLNTISVSQEPQILVSYPDALLEKVITRKALSKNTYTIATATELDLGFLEEFLHTYDFEKTDFVYEPGQFAIRGGIIDIFSFAHELPFRIELFGSVVDSIRTFEPASQLSVADHTSISVIPDIQTKLIQELRCCLLEFISPKTKIWFRDYQLTLDLIRKGFEKVQGVFQSLQAKNTLNVTNPENLFCTALEFESLLKDFMVVEFGSRNGISATQKFQFNASAQPSFHKKFDLLAADLTEKQQMGYSNFIAADLPKQIDRLETIFHEIQAGITFQPLHFSLRQGFIDHQLKVVCYTDHEIFERFHRYRAREKFSKSKALTLKELQSLQPGDFITHIDYGIGKFAGLEKRVVNGRDQEAIRLVFRDDDLLYINIHSLHKITRYTGKDGSPPLISKLGSQEWENKKSRVRKQVRDIAKELIQLYAKRKAAPGFPFPADSYLQAELESSFLYEDTPDQAKATEAVKKDMENPHPMDRLVCGDVGFGKTEVAIRAAFKACSNGKQVAVLVPTTILALQHFRTFQERLSAFPVTIDYISRFRTDKEIKATLQQLKEGKIDILIGTQRIISKDVQFKQLGLLVIDEEQKFGVKAKDRLKELRVNIDVLTLTATPIPRTLHFSLMGARDLSIIATPPPNRQPVTTELHSFNEEIIRDAVSFELRRGGQVFFVHNKVVDIEEVANIIHRLVPDARIGIAHGQMEGEKLEKAMVKFIDGEFDILVSTNIIESGLDIPNANTIIINAAHMFGLSDLHQMRGRVGRSNKKAFCYLLTPPASLLTSDSRKRLAALEEFSDLGDGFKVAMRDLDIRGAGNLLGAEQSGFISDLGFETYHTILDEAIQDLKETEFKELFASELAEKAKVLVQDCIIETDLEILIPETYVGNISERLQLYSRLDNLKSEPQLVEFMSELTDRFGKIPVSVAELVNSVRLRWMGEKLGFERLMLKNGTMRAYFVTTRPEYFNSDTFGAILQFVQKNPKMCRIKDSNGKAYLFIDPVERVDQAILLLNQMIEPGVNIPKEISSK